MAAPVKNFQLPTALGVMIERPPIVVIPRAATLPVAASIPYTFFPWTTVFFGAAGLRPKINAAPRVPLPPMGRQMVLTFPSIYKTRNSNVEFGQIYPPRAK